MRCWPPPSWIFARFSRSSAVRSFMVALPGLSGGVAMLAPLAQVRNLKTLVLTLFSLRRCHRDFVFLTVNSDDVALGWSRRGIAAHTPQGRRFGASVGFTRF